MQGIFCTDDSEYPGGRLNSLVVAMQEVKQEIFLL